MAFPPDSQHPIASGSDTTLDSLSSESHVRDGRGGAADKAFVAGHRPGNAVGALGKKVSLNSLGKRKAVGGGEEIKLKEMERGDATDGGRGHTTTVTPVEEILLDDDPSPSKNGVHLQLPTLPPTSYDILQPRPSFPGLSSTRSILSDSTTPSALHNTNTSSLASSQRPMLGHSFNSNDSGVSGLGSLRPSWKKKSAGRIRGTQDKRRLAALGFEEELERDFDFWALWGIGLCNIGFLPGTFLGVLTALEAGGPSMYSIAWPITGIFLTSLAAIMGEMASTYPVAGAMFTWTFRLCRSSKRFDSWSRYISWINGSFLLCSHILTQIVIAYQLGHLIQGIAMLHAPSFHSTFWKGMGICWAVLIASGAIVSSRLSRSPWLWRACGAFTIAGFVTLNTVLLAKAPQIRSASYVFRTFQNETGWSNKAYVYLIGWCLTCIASGMEACAHMAEDTKKPSRTVPLAMFWSVAGSYVMGWISICIFMATAEPIGKKGRLTGAVSLINNTLPLPYATLCIVIVIIGLVVQNIAQLLATSRFIWALARESALPFSDLFKRISKKTKQPLPAIWVTVGIAGPALMLLGISTSIVGTILLEGAAWTVMAAYLMPVVLYICAGQGALSGDGRAKWSLRGFGIPISYFTSVCACMFLIVLCLPTAYPVTPLSASYAAAVAAGILLLSSLAWIFYGNARYAGPIKTTTRWTIGAEVELPTSTSFKTTTAAVDQTTSAAHGRTAHVFSSFPTLRSGEQTNGSSGEWTSNSEWTSDYDSQMEESRISAMESHDEEAEYGRSRRRSHGNEETSVTGADDGAQAHQQR